MFAYPAKVTCTFVALLLLTAFAVAPALAQVSDDFSAAELDTSLWSFEDPLGGNGFAMVDGRLVLSVAGGTAHDLWRDGNRSVRVVQDVADGDFTIEAKFETVPTQRFQMQGLLVEAAPGEYRRLDFYSRGDGLRLFDVTFVDDQPTVRADLALPAPGAELWLRVQRAGSTWTTSYSLDGSDWTVASTHDLALVVTKVGVYAGNTGSSAPAFDAVVDYFFETSSPIVPEDAGVVDTTPPAISAVDVTPARNAATVAWTTDELANARIAYGPTDTLGAGEVTRATFATDHSLEIPGLAEGTKTLYRIFAEDRSGNLTEGPLDSFTTQTVDNVLPAVTLTAPLDGAAFETGETIALAADASDVDGTITQVEFLVDGTLVGSDTDAPFTSDWSTYTAGSYAITARATDDDGGVSNSAAATVGVAAPLPGTGPIVSDDFALADLDTGVWTFVDPVGGASFAIDDQRLRLSVPSNAEHDLWRDGNESVRVVQPAPDTDFEIEAKFESLPTELFQLQGLLVEEALGRYVRLDFFSQGDGIVRLFGASFVDDEPTIHGNVALGAVQDPLWLRLRRQADTWTASTSADGTNWTERFVFDHTMQVARVGVYGGNSGSPVPAFDVLVDYVFDTAAPIVPEDGDRVPPVIDGVNVVPTARDATITWTTDELATGGVAYGLTDSLELGTVPTDSFATAHEVVLSGLAAETTYFYRVAAQDTVGNAASDTLAQFTTLALPNQPPSVALTSPTEGTIVETGTAVNLVADAIDPDGTVQQVEFLVDDAVVVVDAEAPFDTTWTPTQAGTFAITARATDDDAATTTSAAVSLTVNDPVVGPVIVSDDFSQAELDTTVWTFLDPVGGSSFKVESGLLVFEVTGGVDHDLWVGGNESVRVVQSAPDTDFEIAAQFPTVPTVPFQVQGILVEEAPGRYIRFDHYVDAGGVVRLFSTSFTGDNPTTPVYANDAVPLGDDGLWIRVRRTGDDWQVDHSIDGLNWTQITSFTHAIAVQRVGVYAGNAGVGGGPAPAYTAAVDWFFDTSAPIEPEDGGVLDETPPAISDVAVVPDSESATITWTTDELARGSVAYGLTDSLELGTVGSTLYTTSHSITLDGLQPLTEYRFLPISEDGRGNVGQDSTISTFTTLAAPNVPPTVSITSPAGGTTVALGDTVSLEATASDDDGSVAEVEFLVDDVLVGTDTTAPYSFDWITDAEGVRLVTARARDDVGATTTSDAVTLAVGDSGASELIVSDDFSQAELDSTVWTFLDPVGGSSYRLENGLLIFEVIGGVNHDLWVDGNESVRVVQSAPDTDFEIEAQFPTVPTTPLQLQGLLVEEAPGRYLRFDYYVDTESVVRLFSTSFVNDNPGTFYANDVVPVVGAGLWLRVRRTGDTWQVFHSTDGLNFTEITSFSHAIVVDQVGVYAGNSGADGPSSAPAFTAAVDWFFDTNNPIEPEDGGVLDETPPVISDVTAVPDADFATITWTTDELALGSVAYGLTDSLELGVETGSLFTTSHSITLGGLQPLTEYSYLVISEDGSGNVAQDSTIGTFTTLDAPNAAPTVTVTSPVSGTTVALGDVVTLEATASDGDGSVVEVEFLVDGAVVGIDATAPYSFDWTTDADGVRTITARARDDVGAVTTSDPVLLDVEGPSGPALLVSDDFNRDALDAGVWRFSSRVGDGSARLSDGQLVLEVPGGPAHDLWRPGNDGVTVMQDVVTDGDFVVEADFRSIPTLGFQIQGLLVEAAPDSFTRFDVYHDGSGLFAFSASIDDGDPTFHGSVPIAQAGLDAIRLRLERDGSQYTASYSVDGTNWVQVTSFTRAVPVRAVGLFGGNAPVPSDRIIDFSPAFDVVVDSFVDRGDPLPNEDGGPRVTIDLPPAGNVFEQGTPVDLVARYDATTIETGLLSELALFLDDELFGSSAVDSLRLPWSPTVGTYRVVGRAEDTSGVTSTSAPRTFAVHAPGDVPATFSSDFREATLDPAVWSFVDPSAVAATGTASGRLSVEAPAGIDTWSDPLAAPRWTQDLADSLFALELVLETQPGAAGEAAGLVFDDATGNALRVAITHDGSGNRLVVDSTPAGGATTVLADASLSVSAVRGLRVESLLSGWTVSVSDDLSAYTPVVTDAAIADVFDRVGLAAATDGSGLAPFVAGFDLFSDLAAPVVADDVVTDVDLQAPVVAGLNDEVRAGAGEIALSFSTDEDATVVVEYGTDANYGSQIGPGSPATQHDLLLTGFADDTDVFYRIVVTDAAGNATKIPNAIRRIDAGSPSAIDVWYGLNQRAGHLGDVQPDFNLLGNVMPIDRLTEIGYRVNGGPEMPLSVGNRPDGFGDARRLGRTGDINADIPITDLLVGPNTVTLRALDKDGNESTVDVTVTRETGGSTPLPLTIDWSQVSDPSDVGVYVDGLWTQTADGLRTVETGYDRLFLIGETDWQDYEMLVPVTIHRVDEPGPLSNRSAVGLLLRFQGHLVGEVLGGTKTWPDAQPKYGYLPLGGIGWLRWRGPVDSVDPSIDWYRGDSDDTLEFGIFPITEGGTYMMRMRCETLPDTPEGLGVTRYSYKVWEQGTTEPVGWSFQVDQVSEFALRSGAASLIAHHVDATYGNIEFTPLTPAATIASGDVDGDTEITMDDAGRVLDHVVGHAVLDAEAAARADLGGTEGVDAHDAALIGHVSTGQSLDGLPSLARERSPIVEWGALSAAETGLELPIDVPAGTSLRSWSLELRGEGLADRVRAVHHDVEGLTRLAWHADGDVVRIAFAAATPVSIESTLARLELDAIDPFDQPVVEASARIDGSAPIDLGSQVLSVVPRVFTLADNYPNPFNPQTRIEFGLPNSTRLRLTVFDVRGRRVRSLVDGTLEAGHHRVVWDGTDDAGRRVASGVYLYRLDAPDFTSQKKMLLVK